MAVASCSSRCCWLVVLTVFSTQLVVDTSFIDDNLLSSYSFHRRECLDREFVEEPRRVTGNLRSFEGRTTCLNGNGVRAIETDDADSSFRITSTRNASHLISELANSVEAGSNGLSIELWIERNAGGPYASARYRENMFVAITAGVSSELELCPGNTLISLLDYSGAMSLWFNFNDGDGTQGCALAKADLSTSMDFLSGPYIHVVSIVGDTFQLYLDGSLVYESEFDRPFDKLRYASHKYRSWSADSRLSLFFGASTTDDPDYRNMHALRIYSKGLNSSEVRWTYEQNLRNSLPIVWNMSVRINEDGEADPVATLPPKYYLSKLPIWALGQIALKASDADDSSEHPNQRDTYIREHPMRIVIVVVPRLPGAELFIAHNATSLKDGDEIHRDNDGNYRVNVRPPLNYIDDNEDAEDCPLNFTFNAVDGVTGQRSDEDGFVCVRVAPVNDPPFVIRPISSFVAYTGATALLHLDGVDIEGDKIVGGYIVSTPPNASLHQVSNGTVIASPLAVGDYFSDHLIAFKYRGLVATEDIDSTGIFARRNFSISFVDEWGAIGADERISVEVMTSIDAFPTSQPQTIYEDTEGLVYLYASDRSDEQFDICFRIVHINPSEVDVKPRLFDPSDGSLLSEGDALAVRKRNVDGYTPAAVAFLGALDHFTIPTSRWNESRLSLKEASITYVAFACDIPTIHSFEVTQPVNIVNVGDNANISIEPREFSLYALSSVDADENEYPTSLTLGNDATVAVDDVDRDVDAVRVDIACKFGALNLDQDKLGLADFNSQLYCESSGVTRSWFCKGSGFGDRSMTFIAMPSDVTTLLFGLTYYSLKANVDDVVTISIYDGADDLQTGCLIESQHKTYSVRNSCAKIEISFVIHVQDFASVASSTDASSFRSRLSWQLTISLIAIGITVCCCSCCYFRRSYYRRLRRKRHRARNNMMSPMTPQSHEFTFPTSPAINCMYFQGRAAIEVASDET